MISKLLVVVHTDTVSIPLEIEKDIEEVNSALLGNDEINSPERYPTSQCRQFWVVLKRTLLFSRRDWVRMTYFPHFCFLFPKTNEINFVFCFVSYRH